LVMRKSNNIYIILILVSLSSCKPSIESEQERFKEYIGVGEYKKLTQFMNYMEDKFMDKYEVDNINDAYNSYTINKVLGDSHLEYGIEDCYQLEKIEMSGLIDKRANFRYDTVYQKESLIITVYKKDTSWLVKPPEKWEGEYIGKLKKKGVNQYIHLSEIYEGLSYANSSDTLISQIVDTKLEVGHLNIENLTETIHLKRVNYEQEFLYRVLICLESFMDELKKHECT